ncbi:MAG: acyl-CoA dehydratase activase [Thermodesulfobacteriota bacterium]
MITLGLDVGSLTSKAVILKDDQILATQVIRSKARPWESAREVCKQALSGANLDEDRIDYSIGTGYGRDKIPFVQDVVTEMSCHGRGMKWLLPSARTIIDIGGQDCKVIKLDKSGNIERFSTNDKCASGTGRFLEVMAGILDLELEQLGMKRTSVQKPITLASACTVWAQADVIRHLNSRVPIDDIAAGINRAMASRISVMVNNVGIERELCMTGGVAKNQGVVAALESLLGVKIKKLRRFDPQVIGALGAALLARNHSNGGKK